MRNGAWWGWLAVATAIGGVVYGCGGGGGGGSAGSSSRPPFAGPPTCTSIVRKSAVYKQAMPGDGEPGIGVPATSIEKQSDIGIRAHTNHLISTTGVHSMQSGPTGLNPSQVTTAYSVPANGGSGAIAVVDAYNYPTALNDFNVFASHFGLPTETSTTVTGSSNPVFEVVYAAGSVPANDGGWSQEAAIDVQWTHAMAPNAKIYLVEAASDKFTDIMTAVNVAKSLPGVREVSTSFGGTETSCFYVDYDNNFVRSGVAFFAAAGDSAAVRNYPALSMNVVSVGGTSLTLGPLGIWQSETVWNDTGCGPSAYEPRPVFQDSIYSTIGLYRAGCDIAAVADPNTGVSAYDSFPYEGINGWYVAGGTSVACPIVAGIANSSGVVFSSSQSFNQQTYSQAGSQYFHPITSGSSGGYKAGTPWCYPTGLGTPNNLGAIFGGA